MVGANFLNYLSICTAYSDDPLRTVTQCVDPKIFVEIRDISLKKKNQRFYSEKLRVYHKSHHLGSVSLFDFRLIENDSSLII